MNATDKALMQETDDGLVQLRLRDFPEERRLAIIATVQGDLSPLLTEDQLNAIGGRCVEDYERDLMDREEWEKKVKEGFKRAAQEKLDAKKFPWEGAANVNYPLLTTATIQFAARAYPAIVKGDEIVTCKVVGRDNGRPVIGPDGQPVMQFNGMAIMPSPAGLMLVGPDGAGQPVPPEMAQQVMQAAQPMWAVPPGNKVKRAERVAEYLNTVFFYRMKGWEEDTDTLLHQLPIAGCGFRKVYTRRGEQCAAFVPALKMVVPMSAKNCETAPRMTEELDDKPLNDIVGLQRAEFYREVNLVADDDADAPRKLLEQHCRIDLDEDGYAEPYIVTLDHQTSTVLRIEADFGPDSIEMNQFGEVVSIERGSYYVKYDFLPSFDGSFYGIGLGHLLDEIGTVVNMAINQMIDAGTAQAAGGGFIGSGVNLQGAGKRTSDIRFRPGQYKTVSVSGASLRENIYERTFPGPNPVTYQILDLMLSAAKDISSVKDVLTGEAKNTGQVGTTLALIEQGLQVYTSIQNRINRAVKQEATLVYQNIAAYGGEAAAQDYMTLLDDPQANFEQDFNQKDMDIRPVRDPSSVTNVQRLAKANFLTQYIGAPGINPQAIMRRSFEAANIDDIDDLFLPPQEPDPLMIAGAEADIEGKKAKAALDMQKAETEAAKRGDMAASAQRDQERLVLDALAEGARQGFGQG